MLPYTVKRKIVKSGKYIEIYDYEKPYWVGFPRLQSRFKPKKNIYKDQEKIREDNVKRARKNIKRLVNTNPQLNCFLTLTFAEEIKELKIANNIFNQFIKRITSKHPNFEYLAVPEFQKKGRVHYHVICKYALPDFKDELEKREYERWFAKTIWKNGFVNIKPVNSKGDIGAYISKYLGKEMFDQRFFRKKKFFRSKTLIKPDVFRERKEVKEFTDFFDPKAMTPVFKTDFFSKHTGATKYSLFMIEQGDPTDFEKNQK